MALKPITIADIDIPTAGTRVQVSSTATPISSIVIQSDPANSGYVFVGDADVASGRGIALSAGQSISFVADLSGRDGEEFFLSDFWVDSDTNGNDAKVIYVKRR